MIKLLMDTSIVMPVIATATDRYIAKMVSPIPVVALIGIATVSFTVYIALAIYVANDDHRLPIDGFIVMKKVIKAWTILLALFLLSLVFMFWDAWGDEMWSGAWIPTARSVLFVLFACAILLIWSSMIRVFRWGISRDLKGFNDYRNRKRIAYLKGLSIYGESGWSLVWGVDDIDRLAGLDDLVCGFMDYMDDQLSQEYVGEEAMLALDLFSKNLNDLYLRDIVAHGRIIRFTIEAGLRERASKRRYKTTREQGAIDRLLIKVVEISDDDHSPLLDFFWSIRRYIESINDDKGKSEAIEEIIAPALFNYFTDDSGDEPKFSSSAANFLSRLPREWRVSSKTCQGITGGLFRPG